MIETMQRDIVADHRERMLNLKKYYPFFKLTENNFSQFKDGMYENLDMGYILMAILRFFIEQNNVKEKDVTYPEYLDFMARMLRENFNQKLDDGQVREVSDYIFDKIRNEGRPFSFEYYDPIDRKKRASRVRIIESNIKDNTVWYSISAEAIEFYLDTKEIKDESRISVAQLLLEKMISSDDFKGGAVVVAKINDEVSNLRRQSDQVLKGLSLNLDEGVKSYREFMDTGMQWFDEEERLFKKNTELIEKALAKLNSDHEGQSQKTEAYYRTLKDIYELGDQLKIAMNRHTELLVSVTKMQKMTDQAIKNAKIRSLRSRVNFQTILKEMILADDAEVLSEFIKPVLGIKIRKRFVLKNLDEALTMRPLKMIKPEKVSFSESTEIVYDDELEEERIGDNYEFLMRNLYSALRVRDEFSKKEFDASMMAMYDENIIKNADYVTFFVNLWQDDGYLNKMLDSRIDEEEKIDFTLERSSEDSNDLIIRRV